MTLLQVRHPLATIASGVRGFCADGAANSTPNALLVKMRAFIPALKPHDARQRETCAAVLARFWALYYAQAVEVADGWYRVESATPCQVATAAGFDVACEHAGGGGGAIVMRSNHSQARWSQATSALGAAASAASQHGHGNRHNTDGFSLSYADIERHHGGPRLAAQLQALATRFGYDAASGGGAGGEHQHHGPGHPTSSASKAGSAMSSGGVSKAVAPTHGPKSAHGRQ